MKPLRFFPLTALALGLFLAGSASLHAQSPAAETLQQQVNLRSAAPPPESANSSDTDLGDIEAVQRYPKPAMFTFSTQQQFFYTDNVFYTHQDEQGAMAYLGNYSGSFVPYSLRDWTPRITLQYNMVRYDGVSEANFDNENALFSSQYIFGDDRAWTWTAGVNLSRFTEASSASDHEFYKEVYYDNQVAHTQKLPVNTPLFFVAAYNIAYHQANPSAYDRLDNTLSFSLAWYPVQDVCISTYVRPSWRMYPTDTEDINQVGGETVNSGGNLVIFSPAHIRGQHNRDDFNISTGIDVTWTPIKYLSVSADFNASNDYSNNSALSYDQSSPSISLTGTYKF
jgi:hypothetical protein